MKSAEPPAALISGYTPTLLLGCPEKHPLVAIGSALAGEGWDVRVVSNMSHLAALAKSPEPADAETHDAANFVSAARAIQPDVAVVAGTEDDAWAMASIRELRSDALTHEMGIVVFPHVSIPDDLDLTPMSGPDSWVFLDARPAQAIEVIRKTVRAALDNRLEWAQRDWTPDDRWRYAISALRLRVEQGHIVVPDEMAEIMFGKRARVDVRVWDGPSPHLTGWRFGGSDRYRLPILVQHKVVSSDDDDLGEQEFTFYSRSGRLLLAGAHAAAELAGGWPVVE